MVYVLFGFRVGFSLFKLLVLIFWLICFTVVVHVQQFTIWSKLLPFTQKRQKHELNLERQLEHSDFNSEIELIHFANLQ